MLSKGAGYILAIIAAICNGSFLVPFKVESVAVMKIDPIVFQLYATIGIFIMAWIAAIFLPYNSEYVSQSGEKLDFVPLGALAGSLMVLSMTFSFLATRKIGVALAQGIFGGLAIVVSYIWGTLLFGESASSVALSVFGVITIVLGTVGIGASRELSTWILRRFPWLGQRMASLASSRSTSHANTLDEENHENWGISPLSTVDDSTRQRLAQNVENEIASSDFFVGVVYAVICGIIGGTTLVPLYYVPTKYQGLAFLPSFGIGSLITAPIVLVIYCKTMNVALPPLRLHMGVYMGILAGMVWTINTILTIGAIPILGYAVAFPLVHCSVFISGLWGIFLFKELQGYPLGAVVFYASGMILLAGAVMISIGT